MSVADRLGTGSSFGNVPRGRSARGRAKALTQGDVPAYELVRLRLSEVAPTPLNPRTNFGTDEEKARFGEELRAAQLAACVAISRETYLGLWPEHASLIGDAAFVLVNGERRFRSAQHVGLEALDFVVRNDLASSREEFINFLLKENLDREDFDVVERARGVQALVAVCAEDNEAGSRTRAAERLGMSKAWVTNQLALLTLPDELQAQLSSGDLPERDGRLLARHLKANPKADVPQLLEHLATTREQEARAKQEERALLQAARRGPVLTAVNTEGTEAAPSAPATPPVLTAVNTEATNGTLTDQATPPALTTVDTEQRAAHADGQMDREVPPVVAGAGEVTKEGAGQVPAQATPTHATQVMAVDYAKTLLEELGATPGDQARSIAAALDSTELRELISELRSLL
ncbi:ParB/RepB/Spo0J family partition protein [Streptomyces sp. NBC_01708]|uniref:ParB/RepB/Spo0J family partition protein n=1 Tax=Streptomyces sp. NBC_01708 TaxID=2975915 RepID=UPI002E2FF4EA|nr:ParB/RepB/Spo0J family partition protein [Streptomyces sp. NBC_01708]